MRLTRRTFGKGTAAAALGVPALLWAETPRSASAAASETISLDLRSPTFLTSDLTEAASTLLGDQIHTWLEQSAGSPGGQLSITVLR